MTGDFSRFACLVLAPGVPFAFQPHPVVKKAQEAGIEIICDIEILYRCHPRGTVVGITGTNGKSTTTALAGHILNQCGVPAVIGGNIGVPVLDMSLPPENGALVLELSSFQLDLCPTFSPQIAVHLNLTPDHLDRHGTEEAYAAAKLRLFRGKGDAVIGIDDRASRRILQSVSEAGGRRIYPLSVKTPLEKGAYVENGVLFDAMDHAPEAMFTLNAPGLRGLHNQQNAAVAYVVARLLGCAPEAIAAAMQTFPGLKHRQFLVRTINAIAYINDSKATNADAAARALESYDDIYWIAGGKAKAGGLEGLQKYKDRIRHTFLIGAAAQDFARWLTAQAMPFTISATLERAVQDAHEMAQDAGRGTVLLSPACASYDQFRSFEERGDVFARLVHALQ
jgi:UDP-N-acetylmuramoylalanine--D-glutamate ligase